MQRIALVATVMLVLTVALLPRPAPACERNTGRIFTEILAPALRDLGLQYLSTGEFDVSAWWDLHKTETIADVIGALEPQARAYLAELQVKAEAGDLSLEQYIRQNYRAELWVLIQERGGAKWLISEIQKISPILGDWLEEWVPHALVYLTAQGVIVDPSLEAVVREWPPQLTETNIETLALMAAQDYVAIKQRRRVEATE